MPGDGAIGVGRAFFATVKSKIGPAMEGVIRNAGSKLDSILLDLPDTASVELTYYLLRAGLIAANRDYLRFIILGQHRTGSNLLRGLLNSHSRITTFGELFRERRVIGWDLRGYHTYRRRGSILRQFRNDPGAFLESEVFRVFPKRVSAVGFTIFYVHAHDDAWKPVWEYLRAQRGVRVIHLKRRNVLRTYLSWERAVMSEKWINLSGKEQESGPIALDYEKCLATFVRTRTWEEENDRSFDGHPRLDVIYERLALDMEGEMRRVQEFLGVGYEPVKPNTYRQSRLPLSEAITNYHELKDRFAGTPWEEFFDE